jgi:hypothetical protein
VTPHDHQQYVEGCYRCELGRDEAESAVEDEPCAGCGDVSEFWRDGAWYCYGCASCDVCQSPYCDEPEHRL